MSFLILTEDAICIRKATPRKQCYKQDNSVLAEQVLLLAGWC
uniref:Uncharacterized protein n=1 Tax=Manihot esculenta TaxID=3983 RepID=A0A2C9W321_MANES